MSGILPALPAIAAIEATNAAACAAFAVTRADITAAGLPRVRHDAKWERRQETIWNRFVARTSGHLPKHLDGNALNTLRALFSDLGAINTTDRLMVAYSNLETVAHDLPKGLGRNRHGLARMQAERDHQLTGLKAASPLRSIAPQADASVLPLFAAAQQPNLF